jgi:hypothetical protein
MNSSALAEFQRSQIFGMTLAATTQRSRLYANSPSDQVRKIFHRSFRKKLESLSEAYAQTVREETHIRSIETLASSMSDQHAEILNGGHMRIGHAQKALNLYLKYLWCFGQIPEPPHCPIDSVILKRIPSFGAVRWTRIDSVADYMKVIGAARNEASQKNMSLSQWELHVYNESAT